MFPARNGNASHTITEHKIIPRTKHKNCNFMFKNKNKNNSVRKCTGARYSRGYVHSVHSCNGECLDSSDSSVYKKQWYDAYSLSSRRTGREMTDFKAAAVINSLKRIK